jgi:D-aminoacyl-tRNA deacylase
MFKKIAIITTTDDTASVNIKECLLELYNWKELKDEFGGNPIFQLDKFNDVKLYTTDITSIFCENIDDKIDADLFIFATKHQSKSGIPSLSCHSPGNWTKAEAGGKDRELCSAPSSYLRAAFLKLKELNNLNFDIVQECTHHGPFLQKPVMFIEIGSTENEWERKDCGKIIAKTIHYLTTNEIKECKAVLAIGGLHTMPNFTKYYEKEDIAFAHCCPKYNLENLDKEMILQAMEKSVEDCKTIYLDWKGLKMYKEQIKLLLEELNLEYKKI